MKSILIVIAAILSTSSADVISQPKSFQMKNDRFKQQELLAAATNLMEKQINAMGGAPWKATAWGECNNQVNRQEYLIRLLDKSDIWSWNKTYSTF